MGGHREEDTDDLDQTATEVQELSHNIWRSPGGGPIHLPDRKSTPHPALIRGRPTLGKLQPKDMLGRDEGITDPTLRNRLQSFPEESSNLPARSLIPRCVISKGRRAVGPERKQTICSISLRPKRKSENSWEQQGTWIPGFWIPSGYLDSQLWQSHCMRPWQEQARTL